MAAYLTIAEFKNRTIMPSAQIDRIEAQLSPGWLDAQFEASSRWIDMRLSKRYRVPLGAPVPEIVKSWVARMVTARAYLHHGITASDAQQALVTSDAEKAEAEVKEASDGEIGQIELAENASSPNAVTRGGNLSYSEASPYAQYDVQYGRARRDDQRRRGS